MTPFSRTASRAAIACAIVLCGGLRPALGDDHDQDKKLAELRVRAEQGYVQAEIELAAAYLLGRGVPADISQAAQWYLRAAESGSPDAQNEMGYFYQSGLGVPVDLERAAHWFQLASAAGMARAKVNLGVSYLYGTGVRKDPELARHLFQQAVKKGSGLGAAYLGIMSWFGLGGPVDKEAAEHWFETGVKLHDASAAFDLALLISAPDSKHRDLRRAAELLRGSSEKGYVPAKHALGLLIVNHPELPASQGEAARELREASEAGNWKASVLLGVMTRDGNMTTRDARLACYYFRLGALQGGENAARLVLPDLEALKRKLPADQQSSVETDAKSWFEQHQTPLLYVVKESGEAKYFPLLAVAGAEPKP